MVGRRLESGRLRFFILCFLASSIFCLCFRPFIARFVFRWLPEITFRHIFRCFYFIESILSLRCWCDSFIEVIITFILVIYFLVIQWQLLRHCKSIVRFLKRFWWQSKCIRGVMNNNYRQYYKWCYNLFYCIYFNNKFVNCHYL